MGEMPLRALRPSLGVEWPGPAASSPLGIPLALWGAAAVKLGLL